MEALRSFEDNYNMRGFNALLGFSINLRSKLEKADGREGGNLVEK